ncbi:MAG: SGNH/GDSL hydrolase family protein [Myxococcota bacterium]
MFPLKSRLLLSAFALFFVGCGDDSTPGDGAVGDLRILAMGDSALDFNGDASTVDQLREVLDDQEAGALVVQAAVGGATLGCGDVGFGQEDNCIPPQYEEGEWDWVLLSGGANDILDSGCELETDALINEGGDAGLMVDVIDDLVEMGHKVLLYGYFLPLDPEGETASCDRLVTLLARYRALAEAHSDVVYVDAGAVVQRTQPAYYADDIHPSPEGSRVIAEHIAQALQAAGVL